ncbi:MAG: hypothetical protein DDT30_01676 [Dehalococcoidia bacterium]|nr:hypothetical protein [Bacillota bacterium]MBT9143883.1 hypothetical protein [Bacillota bacterium]
MPQLVGENADGHIGKGCPVLRPVLRHHGIMMHFNPIHRYRRRGLPHVRMDIVILASGLPASSGMDYHQSIYCPIIVVVIRAEINVRVGQRNQLLYQLLSIVGVGTCATPPTHVVGIILRGSEPA